jgi:glycosyltransferase involved in cell wall biosynthesis
MKSTTAAEPPTSGVMLVTKKLEESPSGGRELLCKLNHDILRDIYGDRFVLFELPQFSIRGLNSIFSAFEGYIDGLTRETLDEAIRLIQARKVQKIFVDGSNLGQFVAIVKKKFPMVNICTFFHNAEARFFLGAFRQYKSLRALGVLIVNYLAEKKSVRFSDKIICLNQRDSRLLQKLYGRSATHVSPMSLHDKLEPDSILTEIKPTEKFALFVGGVFYANQAGISWFVKNVTPRIRIKTCIVGRGFEDFKEELECEGKVEVVGAVESLTRWYLNAHFVVAPIFDGSGMKTKVAEALMFGKKIIGTPEAFTGYEEIADRAGRVCVSADDFVAAIEAADAMVKSPFDSELRSIYETTYSYAAATTRLEGIMGI